MKKGGLKKLTMIMEDENDEEIPETPQYKSRNQTQLNNGNVQFETFYKPKTQTKLKS